MNPTNKGGARREFLKRSAQLAVGLAAGGSLAEPSSGGGVATQEAGTGPQGFPKGFLWGAARRRIRWRGTTLIAICGCWSI
jgi:hypothetical protein